MDQSAIVRFIHETFPGVDILSPTEGPGAGDTFFIYDPDRNLEDRQRMPFATIVTKDYGDFDNLSNLNRPGVYRLNIGVSRDTFHSLVTPAVSPASRAGESDAASRPGESDATVVERDYAALDQLLPHPVYAPQSWVCVLNPSPETFATVQPLLAEAYDLVVKRQKARQPGGRS